MRPSVRLGLAVMVALGVQGCGGSTNTSEIRTSVRAYVVGLAHHDARGACAVITPAFWAGSEQSVNAELASDSLRTLPVESCRRGLSGFFALSSVRPVALPRYLLEGVSVHGNTATAILKTAGSRTQIRLIKTGAGVWQIDCCAGAQVDQQATATYRVPSGSMEPTLKIGQSVTVNNAATRAHPPTIGDIIVFHPPAGAESASGGCANPHQGGGFRQACDSPTPSESSETFVKRVVGLPGDRISIVNGHVIRNGKREHDPDSYPCSASSICDFPKPITIPRGEYFVLGDNRAESEDSRFWGPVKRRWIIGVVTS